MTTMTDLTYTERLQVEQLAREIESTGVATVDAAKGSRTTGQRHRFRGPLERLLGYRVEIGVDRDDEGTRFVWFARREEPVSDEQQKARERLGFG